MQLWVALFILIARADAPPVQQADCVDRNFSERLGPARDQGDREWCFAYAAADFLSFHQNQKISAFDVGVHSLAYRTSNKSSAIVPTALAQAPVSGAQDSLSSANDNSNRGKLMSERERGLAHETVESYNRSSGLCTEDQLPSQDKSILSTGTDDYVGSELKRMEGAELEQKLNCGPHQTSRVMPLAPLLNQSAVASVQKQIEAKCSPRKFAKPLAFEQLTVSETPWSKNEGARERLLKSTLETLKSEKPVMVSVAECVLKHKCGGTPAKRADHTTNLVGMKWDAVGKRCMFLARNTWGANWSDCDKSKKMKGFASEPCALGHFWISDRDLMNQTTRATWVK